MDKAADFLDKLTDCQESSGLTFQQIKYALEDTVLEEINDKWYLRRMEEIKA